MILMLHIFDVTANENARYKRNELELVIILDFVAFYPFPLHVHRYVHKYFKHHNNDENHLLFKYVFKVALAISFIPLICGYFCFIRYQTLQIFLSWSNP